MESKITHERNGNFRITIPKHILLGMSWLKDIYDKKDICVIIKEIPPLGKIIIESSDAEILDYLTYIQSISNQKNIKDKADKVNKAKELKKQFDTYGKREIDFLFKIPPSWQITKKQISHLAEIERRKKLITAIEEKKDYIKKLRSMIKVQERDLKQLKRIKSKPKQSRDTP